MYAFPIRNDDDLARAVELIDALWNAAPGTREFDLLQVMSELVDAYEAQHSALLAADPVELVAFKLRELGWSQRELGRRMGWSSGRVSEILNRKRPLTLAMVRDLSRVLELPPGLLVPDARDDTARGGSWVRIPAKLREALDARAKAAATDVQSIVVALLDDALDDTTVDSPSERSVLFLKRARAA